MVLIDLQTNTSRSLLILDNLTGIEYDEKSGELTFVGDNTARPVYLDKGTPANKVWDMFYQSLEPVYAGRAMHVHGIRITIDVRSFQTEETSF